MQKDYPSVIELLFEQAIQRLKKVVKLRKEAIDYYQKRYGQYNPKIPQVPLESTGAENKANGEEIEKKREELKPRATTEVSLKRIDETEESVNETSEEQYPRKSPANKRTNMKTSFHRVRSKRSLKKDDKILRTLKRMEHRFEKRQWGVERTLEEVVRLLR